MVLHFEDYNIGCIELVFSLPTIISENNSSKFQLFTCTHIEWDKSKDCYRVNVDLVSLL